MTTIGFLQTNLLEVLAEVSDVFKLLPVGFKTLRFSQHLHPHYFLCRLLIGHRYLFHFF